MKKIKEIKEKLNKNIVLGISLLVLGLVTGIGILSTGYNILTSVNPFDLQAGDVTYTNNSQSTVQGAIDDLFNKSNTWIDPSYIDFGTIKANSYGTILASSAGVCIKYNDKVNCFKRDNYSYESTHVQNVFTGCGVYDTVTTCVNSSFVCQIYKTGEVYMLDNHNGTNCRVCSLGGSLGCSVPGSSSYSCP